MNLQPASIKVVNDTPAKTYVLNKDFGKKREYDILLLFIARTLSSGEVVLRSLIDSDFLSKGKGICEKKLVVGIEMRADGIYMGMHSDMAKHIAANPSLVLEYQKQNFPLGSLKDKIIMDDAYSSMQQLSNHYRESALKAIEIARAKQQATQLPK